jgi:lysophospholipase L1-like esterase
MNGDKLVQEHIERILQRAQAREQRRQERRKKQKKMRPKRSAAEEAAAPPSLVLVAEGDSWFDYPGTDVLEELEEVYGYDVESVAHRGDTLESMAYGEKQLDGLNQRLEKIASRGEIPRAILLSGGGNDIAGDEFVILLNHVRSGLDAINDDIVHGLLNIRLRTAYIALIRTIGGLCNEHFDNRDIPVIVHGYDYPVPDGRGFWGGWGPLPGPWLEPGFNFKGYFNLDSNTDAMRDLIDRFNDMLSTLHDEPDLLHVHQIDLRGTLSNDLTGDIYKESWDNELHPEEPGFEAVADRFAEVLIRL